MTDVLKPLVGADPELFLKSADGKFLSAHNLIPGSKHEPFKVAGGAVQVDGMALEFNILPAPDQYAFVNGVQGVLGVLRKMIPKEMSFAIEPVAKFDKEYFDKQPAAAKMLGCDPDYNAWTMEMNRPPDNTQPMRTAAGHIHVGWGDNLDGTEHIDSCSMLIKQLDYFLGVPSIFLEVPNERREMYGKAGCFRPKKYGAEYRVLSNFWLKNSATMTWVYKNTVGAFKALTKGQNLPEIYGDEARKIIDNSDIVRAKSLVKELQYKFGRINTYGALYQSPLDCGLMAIK